MKAACAAGACQVEAAHRKAGSLAEKRNEPFYNIHDALVGTPCDKYHPAVGQCNSEILLVDKSIRQKASPSGSTSTPLVSETVHFR
jgi:hypothetical protein